MQLRRFHPIELQLDLERGIRVRSSNGELSDVIEKNITVKVNYFCIQNDEIHQGLISELLYQSKQEENIKVMICVTMYNEPLEELTKSIDGITGSLKEFFEHGFLPHQIAVFVMFDGIDKINTGKDNTNDDVISYFIGHCDEKYEIQKEMTLKKQHKEYQSKKKDHTLYSEKKLELYSIQQNQAKQLFKDNKISLEKHKEKILMDNFNKAKQINPNIIKPDPKKKNLNLYEKLQCMREAYNVAASYMQAKQNSALVYQDKHDFKYKKGDQNIEDYLPLFYVFKYENGTKLSSHMWFFKGFCQLLKPQFCLLMDAGAIPKTGSICKLIFAMEQNPKIGGVCGTMRIDLSSKSSKEDYIYKDIFTKYLSRIFSLKRCQSCEYDIGHIFDKQFEASMNYIHVLPGAFSAYRYEAFFKKFGENLQQENQKKNILDIYLKQVLDQYHEHDTLEEANMFLAEDRVLCQLLFCNKYYLRYVIDASVKVDPQNTVFKLLNQRRRWINGTWFALNYVVDNFRLHLRDEDQVNKLDKWLFLLNLTFAKMNQIQQYYMLSFQTVWNYMILDVIFSEKNRIIIFKTDDTIYNSIMKQLFIAVYIFLVLMLIFLSLSYNPSIFDQIQDEKKRESEKKNNEIFFISKFYGVSTLLGLMSLFTVGFTIYLFYTEIIVNDKLFLFFDQPYVPSNYLFLFVVISIFFQALPYLFWLRKDFRMVLSVLISLIHYFYYLPTYTHLFQIFSFCRIDDLSWGTKGLATNKTFNSNTDKTYEKFYFLCKWIVLNSFLTTIIFILFYLQINLIFAIIILSFTVIFTLITIFKSIGAIIYQLFYSCYVKQMPESDDNQINESIKRSQKHMALIAKLYNQIE